MAHMVGLGDGTRKSSLFYEQDCRHGKCRYLDYLEVDLGGFSSCTDKGRLFHTKFHPHQFIGGAWDRKNWMDQDAT